jgi:hypothetical protein
VKHLSTIIVNYSLSLFELVSDSAAISSAFSSVFSIVSANSSDSSLLSIKLTVATFWFSFKLINLTP